LTSPGDTPRSCQSRQACLVNLSCTSTTLNAKRRTGGAGRAGYDPDMLLTLLI
jgi:hypothetical protein